MSSVVTALQCLAHGPLSLHLLAQNTLTNYKLNDLFYYLTKVLSAMPYALLFADTHSWVCFSIGSQHSSHINSRDRHSTLGGKNQKTKQRRKKKKRRARHFNYSLTSLEGCLYFCFTPFSLEATVRTMSGSKLPGTALTTGSQDFGVELHNWTTRYQRWVWSKLTK